MNALLWTLQGLGTLLYLASGVMKAFTFDKIKDQVPSFAALPRGVWMALGLLELVCAAGLLAPAALHWHPTLTVMAAAILAGESLIFIWVHLQYRETGSLIMSAALGAIMAFLAYGRYALAPIV